MLSSLYHPASLFSPHKNSYHSPALITAVVKDGSSEPKNWKIFEIQLLDSAASNENPVAMLRTKKFNTGDCVLTKLLEVLKEQGPSWAWLQNTTVKLSHQQNFHLCHSQESGIRKMLFELLAPNPTVPAVIRESGGPVWMAGLGARPCLLDPNEQERCLLPHHCSPFPTDFWI